MSYRLKLSIRDDKVWISNRIGTDAIIIEDDQLVAWLLKQEEEPEMTPEGWDPKSEASTRAREEARMCITGEKGIGITKGPFNNPYDKHYNFEKWNDYANAWRVTMR